MEAPEKRAAYEADKAAIDASLPGSMTFSVHASARVGASDFGEAFSRQLQRFPQEDALCLFPLRLVVMTSELGSVACAWQRALGLAEAGVSQHAEGGAVGKTMFWGRDADSARSVIILADYIGAGVVANNSIAISTLVHELGHVHDDLLRGVALGFRESQNSPRLADWPSVRAQLAEIAWSEYAADSIAASQMAREDLAALMLNDPVYVAGVDERLGQAVWEYKRRERTLGALWSGAVTEICDCFANLGRAAARLPFADSYEEALGRLSHPSDKAHRWKTVIEQLVRELEALGSTNYSEWGTSPFSGIQNVIEEGFRTVGLFPTYDDGKLHVRVE